MADETKPRVRRRTFAEFDEAATSITGAKILRGARRPFEASIVTAELVPIAVIRARHSPPILAHATVPQHCGTFPPAWAWPRPRGEQ